MFRCFALSLLYFIAFSANSQTREVFDLIDFNSELERTLFEDLYEGDTNGVALLMVAGGVSDSSQLYSYDSRLSEVFSKLDSSRLVRKKPKKIISNVFETVHDELLRKYEFENQFCEVFQTGNYNCVSATALYSYMLGRLGVAHALVQTPDHVYAVAFINEETWILESTDPQQGYYEVTEKDREKSLDELVDQKIITRDQRNSPKLDSIIQHLFPEEAIGSAKLVSIQYSNQALYDLEKERNFEAFQNAAKAYVISPDTATISTLVNSAAFWLDEEDFENEYFLPTLSFVVNKYMGNPGHQELIFSNFLYYGAMYLEDAISDSLFEAIGSTHINASASDSSFQSRVTSYYYDYKAQKLLTARKAVQAFPFAKSAVKHYCDNESRRILVGTISMMLLYGQFNTTQVLDTVRTLNKQFPQMRENEIWIPIYLELLTNETFAKILQDDFTSARKLFGEFESIASNEYVAVMDQRNLEKVYGRMLTNYYKSDKRRARQILEDGLAYMPHSEILQYYERKLNF